VGADARRLLRGYGTTTETGEWVTVEGLDGDRVPDLVAGLVGLGVRVLGVEPARQTLEERLLGVLTENREGGAR
jgi:ABC-2 type transport system ATP-binding protein